MHTIWRDESSSNSNQGMKREQLFAESINQAAVVSQLLWLGGISILKQRYVLLWNLW